jgi:hypothetical protein
VGRVRNHSRVDDHLARYREGIGGRPIFRRAGQFVSSLPSEGRGHNSTLVGRARFQNTWRVALRTSLNRGSTAEAGGEETGRFVACPVAMGCRAFEQREDLRIEHKPLSLY